MIVSDIVNQTWTLTKKDLLLIARRRWFSTFIRAVAFPIVLTAILASVKTWIQNGGGYGVGTPSRIRSLPEAFDFVGDLRKKFVIVDRGLQGSAIRGVIDELSSLARDGNRDLHIVQDATEIASVCPSSSKGATDCFGAVDFWSSPDQGPGSIFNYTIWQDSVIRGVNVRSDSNGIQIYTLPLQLAVDRLISIRTNGTPLSETILQYPYTSETQEERDFKDRRFYGLLVTQALAFALFLAMAGIAYHLTGHVVRQREDGMLQLIDAQMPNKSRWESLTARMFATHLAFDIIYMPAWIVCGAVVGTIIFPASATGWFVLMYVLAGLAMTSFSVLASSLFRRQQLSAISAIVAAISFAIVAQFSQSGQRSTNTAAATATGLLFPPSSFVYFLVIGAVGEIFQSPLALDTGLPPLLGTALGINIWTLTPAHFLGFFAFQIALYPILAMVVERFMWGSSFEGREFKSVADMDGNALRIRNFTKRYKNAVKQNNRTLAVNQLSVDLYAGSITVLLGSNGSGKSTTMKCISGLESITDGRIEIDSSGGIGLCPQQNVMFADMTVEENIYFFQRLKAPSMSAKQSNIEVTRLIEGCDLKRKAHAKSKTLSGGQQRKLQLSMMLAGGSRVCCIDEASSGIDPLARRKIWDILLRERGQRTLLLTTHFLDESEVLADHIAILSKGKLRAEGTVASLKSDLGGGYRITLPDVESSSLIGIVTDDHIRFAQSGHGTVLDVTDGALLAKLLDSFDQRGFDYKVEGPSIEKIFLKLADEIETEDQTHAANGGHSTKSGSVKPAAMMLHTGMGCGPVRQTGVLYHKRLTILKHNFMPYLAALFVPLVVAGLVTRFLLNVEASGLQCRNPDVQTTWSLVPQSLSPASVAFNLVFGPPSRVTAEYLRSILPNATFCYPGSIYCDSSDDSGYAWPDVTTPASLQEFNDNIAKAIGGSSFHKGGFYIDENGPPVFAWLGDGNNGAYSAWTTLGVTDMVLANTSVAVSYNNFVQGYAPRDFFQSLVAVFTTLGFILFTGLFALYPTRERLQKVRAMQYSNGILSGPLWTAYALFDFGFLLLIAVLTTVIWLVNGYNWYGLGYMFIVFPLYGMAATAYSYIVSLLAPSQLAAIAMTAIIQVVIAMLFFVGCFLTVDSADLSVLYRKLDIIYYTIALISPPVSLLRALLVVMNVYALACRGESLASNPGHISLYGAPILYLVIQFFLFVAFLIFWESGRSLEAFGVRLRSSDSKDLEKVRTASDASEGSDRLSSTNDGLRVQHISKTFGSNKAVDNVSFGILPSEKFALLGPNGGGKTTTISLIRGDLRPDASAHRPEVHISGDSLMHAPIAAKQHLGVCPQFDSVDSMTLTEHLEFYARARGVTGQEKKANINEISTRLGLQEHKDKLVKKLSGGTKRKLSLGIALIANPSVLLLDEPSSGMDAAAKRALWETLRAISAGRSLLITTHSMEEADALCDRAGIMAGQMLALGTISSLHERYSENVYIQLVHKDAPRSSPEDIHALWQWVRSRFLITETEKSVGGQLRFAVPIRKAAGIDEGLVNGANMGRLFRAIEEAKTEMGIRDYSIGHATLDQVFLNVVGRNGVDEENNEVVRGRGRGWGKGGS